jgi:hypothetical protein
MNSFLIYFASAYFGAYLAEKFCDRAKPHIKKALFKAVGNYKE